MIGGATRNRWEEIWIMKLIWWENDKYVKDDGVYLCLQLEHLCDQQYTIAHNTATTELP